MSGHEFKARLRLLGRSQVGFAREIGKSLRAVHTWASSGPPPEIVYLLDLMMALEQPLGHAHDIRQGSDFSKPLEHELNRLMALAGERRDEFLQIVRKWSAASWADESNKSTLSNR